MKIDEMFARLFGVLTKPFSMLSNLLGDAIYVIITLAVIWLLASGAGKGLAEVVYRLFRYFPSIGF